MDYVPLFRRMQCFEEKTEQRAHIPGALALASDALCALQTESITALQSQHRAHENLLSEII